MEQIHIQILLDKTEEQGEDKAMTDNEFDDLVAENVTNTIKKMEAQG